MATGVPSISNVGSAIKDWAQMKSAAPTDHVTPGLKDVMQIDDDAIKSCISEPMNRNVVQSLEHLFSTASGFYDNVKKAYPVLAGIQAQTFLTVMLTSILQVFTNLSAKNRQLINSSGQLPPTLQSSMTTLKFEGDDGSGNTVDKVLTIKTIEAVAYLVKGSETSVMSFNVMGRTFMTYLKPIKLDDPAFSVLCMACNLEGQPRAQLMTLMGQMNNSTGPFKDAASIAKLTANMKADHRMLKQTPLLDAWESGVAMLIDGIWSRPDIKEAVTFFRGRVGPISKLTAMFIMGWWNMCTERHHVPLRRQTLTAWLKTQTTHAEYLPWSAYHHDAKATEAFLQSNQNAGDMLKKKAKGSEIGGNAPPPQPAPRGGASGSSAP